MSCSSLTLLIFTVLAVDLISALPFTFDLRPHVSLYDHENHQGEAYHQDVGQRCYNLPRVFDDRASSIDTHTGCIKVCTERNCKGCYNMQPGTKGHFKLKEVHLNDNISSFTQC